jgi:hypothetical protein
MVLNRETHTFIEKSLFNEQAIHSNMLKSFHIQMTATKTQEYARDKTNLPKTPAPAPPPSLIVHPSADRS